MFAGTRFNKIDEKVIGLNTGEGICCSTLFDENKMIVMATQSRVMIYQLPSLAEIL